MKIEAVDFFYLAMPEIKDIGDGSQDALLVRIQAGDHEGWGTYGRGTVEQDRDHVQAAREGLGPDGILLIDAGTVWQDDVNAA